MNRFTLVLILAAFIMSVACGSTKEQEVVDFSGVKDPSDSQPGETRSNHFATSDPFGFNKTAAGQTGNVEGNDNSKIVLMTDRSGNKTEIRTFQNHQRLSSVVVQTDVNGFRIAYIYGQNGETVLAPESILPRLLTASADEIANAANIYQTVTEGDFIYTQKPRYETSLPLKPMPSSQFPINPPPAPQTLTEEPVEEANQSANDAEQNPNKKEAEKPTIAKVNTQEQQ